MKDSHTDAKVGDFTIDGRWGDPELSDFEVPCIAYRGSPFADLDHQCGDADKYAAELIRRANAYDALTRTCAELLHYLKNPAYVPSGVFADANALLSELGGK